MTKGYKDAMAELRHMYAMAPDTQVPPVDIVIVDDGTLDNLFKCANCGKTWRYSFGENEGYEQTYEDWRDNLQDEIREGHDCRDPENDEF